MRTTSSFPVPAHAAASPSAFPTVVDYSPRASSAGWSTHSRAVGRIWALSSKASSDGPLGLIASAEMFCGDRQITPALHTRRGRASAAGHESSSSSLQIAGPLTQPFFRPKWGDQRRKCLIFRSTLYGPAFPNLNTSRHGPDERVAQSSFQRSGVVLAGPGLAPAEQVTTRPMGVVSGQGREQGSPVLIWAFASSR